MAKLFFGKIGANFFEQKEEKFYAGGPVGSEVYCGIQPGDYVFPIYAGKVDALWRVREYGNKQSRLTRANPGVVFFDEIKKLPEPLRLTTEFLRYKYFLPDLNLLNKSTKWVIGKGFIPIALAKGHPHPEDMDIKRDLRRFFVSYPDTDLSYKQGDVRVVISNDLRIIDIVEFDGSSFVTLSSLYDLYLSKNPEGQRFSLDRLLDYSKIDEAVKKEKYLTSVLAELQNKGYFIASSPVALYDNILVGRKKSQKKIIAATTHEEETEAEDTEQEEDLLGYDRYAELLGFNPNLILYGPPGTGKTYATSRIIEAFERRKENETVGFRAVKKQGRVKFITFHQAYSYEEFVEGIRPVVADDIQSESDDSRLKYHIEDGVLKRFAQAASREYMKAGAQDTKLDLLRETGRVWKVSLGFRNDDKIYNECIRENIIAVGFTDKNLENMAAEDIYDQLIREQEWEKKPTMVTHILNAVVNEMETGDAVLIYDSPTTIRDIGVITGGYQYRGANHYHHMRPVTWLKHFEEPVDVYKLNGETRLTLKTIYELNRINMTDVMAILNQDQLQTDTTVANARPYYLVIDEINRGNIAKVFGELITLIEKDKRNSLECELPYSKKRFTLPPNLYIIGTMNTADRSIAVLDTALRRRFSFIEIEPSLEVFNLPSVEAKINDTVELPKLLEALNKKVAEKLDRDHRIGHSYFMDVVSLDDLYNTWYYKILPLLTEYFYNDLTSVSDVAGKRFFDQQGGVSFLSKQGQSGEPSEFEQALLAIYAG